MQWWYQLCKAFNTRDSNEVRDFRSLPHPRVPNGDNLPFAICFAYVRSSRRVYFMIVVGFFKYYLVIFTIHVASLSCGIYFNRIALWNLDVKFIVGPATPILLAELVENGKELATLAQTPFYDHVNAFSQSARIVVASYTYLPVLAQKNNSPWWVSAAMIVLLAPVSATLARCFISLEATNSDAPDSS